MHLPGAIKNRHEKALRFYACFFLLLFFMLYAPVTGAYARDGGDGERIVKVPVGEVVEGDFFAYGDAVEIYGTVNGDVYAAARHVLVEGTVNGDLLAAGGRVSVRGRVAGDARIAGGQVIIGGEIGRNLSVASGDVELTGSVAGSVAAGAGRVSINGPVGGSLSIAAGSVVISSRVGGDVEAVTERLRVSSRGVVSGGVTYWSTDEALIDRNARISGSVIRNMPLERAEGGSVLGFFAALSIFVKTASIISTLAAGLLLVRVFPGFSRRAAQTIGARPWSSLGLGFAVFILVPAVSFILLLTIVGVALSLLLAAMYMIALYLARVFAIYWAGSVLFRKLSKERWGGWPFAAGMLVYSVLIFVPLLGFLISLFVTLFGLGAAALTKYSFYMEAKKKGVAL